ncbi:MAG: mannose-1-phosphate guanylyltransferase/mannose-6-phosphate isomerase [Betaproteobacteria bacterium]
MNIYPVVLSGGSGTRLWPMSRQTMPKQFLPLLPGGSPFQMTLARLSGLAGGRAPIIIASNDHRFVAAEQLRAANVTPGALVLEPVGRNTAPAAAIAAIRLVAEDRDALMLVLPADHHVPDALAFRELVNRGAEVAGAGHLVTFGVTPRWAETGYGYIERGAALPGLSGCYDVAEFIEKPEIEIAAHFAATGRHYWNSGMFLFGAAHYLAELEAVQPALVAACRRSLSNATRDQDFLRLESASFANCPSISIDYALMEHTARAAVLPVELEWSDIGSWKALWDVHAKDENGNVVVGDVRLEDVRDCYVNASRRLVVGIGLENLVIIETPDAILVSSQDEVQRVRQIVEQMRTEDRPECVAHSTVFRPWGSYEDIDSGTRFRVKRITVKPGAKLSLQMHHHRAEHWVVVTGTARITRGEEVILLSENQSTYIPLGVTHRLENPGRIPLQMIEVQSGAYLAEDDIVRFEDLYSRVP